MNSWLRWHLFFYPQQFQLQSNEEIDEGWKEAVRSLPIKQRIDRVKMGFQDPDITKEDLK